jgi:hypothetical protein
MLYRTLQLPEGRSSFRNVQNGAVLGKAVGAIVQAGIARGYPDGTFRPNQPLTRGQRAVMITCALGYEMRPSPIKTLLYHLQTVWLNRSGVTSKSYQIGESSGVQAPPPFQPESPPPGPRLPSSSTGC